MEDDIPLPLLQLIQGSEALPKITDPFAPLMKPFRIYFFWEQEKTDLPHSKTVLIYVEWTLARQDIVPLRWG